MTINNQTNKLSTAVIVYPQEFSGSNTLVKYDEGVYVNDISVLQGSSILKLRPNNDFLKIKNGKISELTEGPFDDLDAPLFLTQSQASFTLFNRAQGDAKLSGIKNAPSHFILNYDFGQSSPYQDGSAFEEVDAPLSPVNVILADSLNLSVPFELVNVTDARFLDSTIDVFSVRKEVDRSYTEIPFRFKGCRGDLVIEDAYRRSYTITDEVESVASRMNGSRDRLRGADPFLDASDEFGIDDFFGVTLDDTMTGPISVIGYVNPPSEVISPFIETTDLEIISTYFNNLDSSMREAIFAMSGTDSPGNTSLSKDHISLPHGFVYDNCRFGVDSLAFGGLLK